MNSTASRVTGGKMSIFAKQFYKQARHRPTTTPDPNILPILQLLAVYWQTHEYPFSATVKRAL